MHADHSGGISVGLVAESRIGGYVVMEVQFDFVKHLFTIHPASLRFEFGTLYSACMFYLKNPHEESSFVCALSTKGVLSVTTPGSDLVQGGAGAGGTRV